MRRTNPVTEPGDAPTGRAPGGQPSLIRFLLINAGIGASVAVGVVATLILTDTQSLGRLIWADQDPAVAVLLLVFGFVITLGSAAMGAAIMGLPYGDRGASKGCRSAGQPGQILEPAHATASVTAPRG